MTPYQEHVAKWRDCTRCHLHEGRSKVVFARGKLPCDVLFVGEAPGESEDVIGSPFVGPAGRLLDDIVALSIPSTVRLAFTNLVGCVPRDAATGLKTGAPDAVAIKACSGKLFELVRIAKPKLVVCVGALAKKHVATQVRTCDIVHPSFILSKMNAMQQKAAVQRCVVTLASAVEEL